MNKVLFDPFLFRALRKVARGEIGTTSAAGALRHRTEDLPIRLFSALYMLRRDAQICLSMNGPDSTDGWIIAELTPRGRQLLANWNERLVSGSSSRTESDSGPARSTADPRPANRHQ